MPDLRRAGVLLQAALLVLGLLVAPAYHRSFCGDACSVHATGSPERPACAAHSKGAARHEGCECLGDCCSITACCVAAETPADLAPPTPLPSSSPIPVAESEPRASGARLLPYPTGPPPAV